ncbi:205 kDa microtubule-associated protein-like isoform X2 [Ctenocephalides felis]|uniref:205 kDa microtubule-associated protein-like isoform X2 n=1 Tax=Ctenocephalides felis TaxID=7515 RepID=UPI000E6E27F8|nr:205 kDa microtubule-associated protein-like isoform X2 [Ctenocephalides felis]
MYDSQKLKSSKNKLNDYMMASQLNPEAAEFVPVEAGSPARSVLFLREGLLDDVMARSPRQFSAAEQVLNVPSDTEFASEIKSRPGELSANGSFESDKKELISTIGDGIDYISNENIGFLPMSQNSNKFFEPACENNDFLVISNKIQDELNTVQKLPLSDSDEESDSMKTNSQFNNENESYERKLNENDHSLPSELQDFSNSADQNNVPYVAEQNNIIEESLDSINKRSSFDNDEYVQTSKEIIQASFINEKESMSPDNEQKLLEQINTVGLMDNVFDTSNEIGKDHSGQQSVFDSIVESVSENTQFFSKIIEDVKANDKNETLEIDLCDKNVLLDSTLSNKDVLSENKNLGFSWSASDSAELQIGTVICEEDPIHITNQNNITNTKLTTSENNYQEQNALTKQNDNKCFEQKIPVPVPLEPNIHLLDFPLIESKEHDSNKSNEMAIKKDDEQDISTSTSINSLISNKEIQSNLIDDQNMELTHSNVLESELLIKPLEISNGVQEEQIKLSNKTLPKPIEPSNEMLVQLDQGLNENMKEIRVTNNSSDEIIPSPYENLVKSAELINESLESMKVSNEIQNEPAEQSNILFSETNVLCSNTEADLTHISKEPDNEILPADCIIVDNSATVLTENVKLPSNDPSTRKDASANDDEVHTALVDNNASSVQSGIKTVVDKIEKSPVCNLGKQTSPNKTSQNAISSKSSTAGVASRTSKSSAISKTNATSARDAVKSTATKHTSIAPTKPSLVAKKPGLAATKPATTASTKLASAATKPATTASTKLASAATRPATTASTKLASAATRPATMSSTKSATTATTKLASAATKPATTSSTKLASAATKPATTASTKRTSATTKPAITVSTKPATTASTKLAAVSTKPAATTSTKLASASSKPASAVPKPAIGVVKQSGSTTKYPTASTTRAKPAATSTRPTTADSAKSATAGNGRPAVSGTKSATGTAKSAKPTANSAGNSVKSTTTSTAKSVTRTAKSNSGLQKLLPAL